MGEGRLDVLYLKNMTLKQKLSSLVQLSDFDIAVLFYLKEDNFPQPDLNSDFYF